MKNIHLSLLFSKNIKIRNLDLKVDLKGVTMMTLFWKKIALF